MIVATGVGFATWVGIMDGRQAEKRTNRAAWWSATVSFDDDDSSIRDSACRGGRELLHGGSETDWRDSYASIQGRRCTGGTEIKGVAFRRSSIVIW